MSRIENDILKAKILINNMYRYELSFDNYRYFEQIYPFTTENIKGYYDLIDFKDKDVLTVGSSGDHTLNLYLNEVKSVDFFDINSFSKYYFDLKKAAIQALEIEEFFSYFCLANYPVFFKLNTDPFDIKLYHKLSPYLCDKSRYFWDSLYLDNRGLEIRNSDLFSKDEEKYSTLKYINEYLDEKLYYDLKTSINKYPNPHFYNSNIKELKLKKKYDVIMLSNIAKYLEYMYLDNYLDNFKSLIDKLEENLNEDGIILLSYIYDIYNICFCIYEPPIYNIEEVGRKFDNLDIIKFLGINSVKFHRQKHSVDAVLIHKKTKK